MLNSVLYKVAIIFWNTSVAEGGWGCVKCNPRGSGAACISKVSRICSQIHIGITAHSNEMYSTEVWTCTSVKIINRKI